MINFYFVGDGGVFFFVCQFCFVFVLFLNPYEAKHKLCLLKVEDERCASKCLCVCVCVCSFSFLCATVLLML